MPSIACEEYPIGLATLPLVGEDRTCYRERLLKDSSRLFKNDETDIEVLQCNEEDERKYRNTSISYVHRRVLLTDSRCPILQTGSWSRCFRFPQG